MTAPQVKEQMDDTITQQTNKRTNEWINELTNERLETKKKN